MKYSVFFSMVLCLSQQSFAQGGWTKISDALSPLTSFHPLSGFDGAAWVDIDRDDDIDLFIAPDNLFRNEGNGQFVRLNTSIGGTSIQKVAGSTWADIDNDGDIDCFLSRFPSRLYRNDGSGTFTEDAAVFTTLADYTSWGCAWGDANNDGLLDLVLAHPRGFLGMPYYPSFYFKQNAPGQLEPVTGYYFTDNIQPYTVPYWSDFDLDGDMDLFIASGPGGTPGPDFCYKNMFIETGNDTLVSLASEQFAADMQDGQCYNFIDYDNDGDLDLCLVNWIGSNTKLYNNNNGVYTAVSTPFSYARTSLSNAWGDFDNDGDLDVIISNANQAVPGFYQNNGNGVFTSVMNAVNVDKGATSVALGDYDNDGDIDVFSMSGDTLHPQALFRNDLASGNHWLTIKCIGTITNKSAIGTKVRIKATINGIQTWQIREILAQNTFQGQHDLRTHFGLGNATIIDSVIVDFLGGHTNIFTNVQPDKFYSIIEDAGISTVIHEMPGKQALDFDIFPNPASATITIKVHEPGNYHFSINTAKGRLIRSEQHRTGAKPISLHIDSLPAGSYFITVSNGEKQASKQFVKVK